MREEKIFEEISRASAENSHAAAKKAASASATTSSSNHASSSVTTTTAASNQSTPVAIKSEPTASTSSANNSGTPKPSSEEDGPKPGTSASAGVVTPRSIMSSRGRGAGRPIQQRQQPIMPRYWSYSSLFLHLLLTVCKFWHLTNHEVFLSLFKCNLRKERK